MNLLPNYFKYIGAVCAVSFVMTLVIIQSFTGYTHQYPVLKKIFELLLILCLALIILSREKKEDEFIRYSRMRAAAFAFITGILSYVFRSFFTFFDVIAVESTFSCLLSESVFYLLIFHITIWGGLTNDK
ncbi:hypothetical protein FAM09_28570 [Niastella caeni]|uniref:Uncharacterized protein n=1 Tax=Niastella caeni TaxID=2569763 RepID=A0A4S8HBG3_9BACT|nr:hypothetical protein [Niastella caeni]THU31581.1 hypothetical protein FAM09_28570 [Niastella caeni]